MHFGRMQCIKSIEYSTIMRIPVNLFIVTEVLLEKWKIMKCLVQLVNNFNINNSNLLLNIYLEISNKVANRFFLTETIAVKCSYE